MAYSQQITLHQDHTRGTCAGFPKCAYCLASAPCAVCSAIPLNGLCQCGDQKQRAASLALVQRMKARTPGIAPPQQPTGTHPSQFSPVDDLAHALSCALEALTVYREYEAELHAQGRGLYDSSYATKHAEAIARDTLKRRGGYRGQWVKLKQEVNGDAGI